MGLHEKLNKMMQLRMEMNTFHLKCAACSTPHCFAGDEHFHILKIKAPFGHVIIVSKTNQYHSHRIFLWLKIEIEFLPHLFFSNFIKGKSPILFGRTLKAQGFKRQTQSELIKTSSLISWIEEPCLCGNNNKY